MSRQTLAEEMMTPTWRIAPMEPPPPPAEKTQGSSKANSAAASAAPLNTRAKLSEDGNFSAKAGESAGRRRGRRRRTQPAAEEKKLGLEDPGLRSLLSTLFKSHLQTRQQVRLISGMMLDTLLLPGENLTEEKMQPQQHALTMEAKKRREAATDGTHPIPIGPPVRSLSLAFLEALIESDVSSGNKTALRQIHQRWETLEPHEIDDSVQACRFNRTSADKLRVVIGMPRGPERVSILAAARALEGAVIFSGKAPPDFMEEELQDWLQLAAG